MDGSAALRQLVDRYYRDWWQLCPTAGSRAGLYEFDAQLELPGRDWIEQRRRQLAQTTAALTVLNPPQDGGLDSLDYRVFQSHLAVAQVRLDQLQHWRHDPSGPVTEAVDAVFELFMRRDLKASETAQAILSRLEKLPAYLGAARDRTDEPVQMWTAIAAQTIPGGLEFIRDAARELSSIHPRLGMQIESAAASACDALEEYAHWIRSLKEQRLNENIAAGPAVMQTLLHQWHGLDNSLDEVDSLGHSLVEFFREELEAQARRIDRNLTWKQILEQARDRFIAERHDMLAEYRLVTDGLRARFLHSGALDLPPGESCKVISTPAFLRAFLPTAAYTSPGPLDPRQVGVFFVSDPDPQLGPDAFRANVAQHYGIEETCVHEAYPGHHVQLCWANRAGSLARQMADHIIFMEGWTLYCEQWMIDEEWFPDPALKINYLLGQLWRAYRIVIDIGIHTGRMTAPQAGNMLMEGVGFTRERAVTELNWYSQSPGVPLSYMMGKRETLELRDEFLKKPGARLRDFHSWLLQFGSVPQKWLWSQLPKASAAELSDNAATRPRERA